MKYAKDKTYRLLVSKMHEIALVPPQTVGPFTHIYKKIIPHFKYSPWRMTALISFVATVSLYFIFGSTLVRLASVLQFGF